jgi:hypothetical protein
LGSVDASSHVDTLTILNAIVLPNDHEFPSIKPDEHGSD